MDRSKHHGVTTSRRPRGKEEKQKRLQARQMNDGQTPGVSEAEASICPPAEMRITRLHTVAEERGEPSRTYFGTTPYMDF